jgi:hypothetical protein
MYQSVFDPEMQLFFAGITKVDKWKWELDVAANKTGGRYSPNPEPTKEGDISFDVQRASLTCLCVDVAGGQFSASLSALRSGLRIVVGA